MKEPTLMALTMGEKPVCPVCQRRLVRVARGVTMQRRRASVTLVRKGWACAFCKVIVQLFELHEAWKTC